jgi:hypothetical protein
MDDEHSATRVSWAARVNTRVRHDANDCPTWANPADRERWCQKGLILWQTETQHIVRLFATYALQLLEDLHNDDAWHTQGIVVGEPVIHLTWGESGTSSEPGLHNPIRLSPRQTKSLHELLERNRAALEVLKRQEDEDRDRAMKELASILADIYIRSKVQEDALEDSSTE